MFISFWSKERSREKRKINEECWLQSYEKLVLVFEWKLNVVLILFWYSLDSLNLFCNHMQKNSLFANDACCRINLQEIQRILRISCKSIHNFLQNWIFTQRVIKSEPGHLRSSIFPKSVKYFVIVDYNIIYWFSNKA